MNATLKRPAADSDSEEDEDYVPPAERNDSDSEGDSSDAQPPKPEPAKEEVKEKKDLSKVWQEFQATVNAQSTAPSSSNRPKLVKVVKKFRFAGEEQEEVIEVPETSDDAKRWPRYDPSRTSSTPSALTSTPTPTFTTNAVVSDPSSSTLTNPAPTTSSSTQPKRKPPGPRKPKTTLAPLPSSKAKKLTTLEKSAMEWSKHQATAPDKDELEAHRRGGDGYLDKVVFLNRVEERKEDVLKGVGSGKRRKL